MSANCAEPGGGLVLRRAGDGGVAELPYIAAVLTHDGDALPVPVRKTEQHEDGGMTLRGDAHGFSARLRLAAPTGDARSAALTVRRTARLALAGRRAA